MKYRAEWKRRRLNHDTKDGIVSDMVHGVLGHVFPRVVEGACTTGGMRTNKVWDASHNHEQKEFSTLTEAIEWLIEKNEEKK